ncbi:thiamine pyrophosphate-dependent enzyme [Streptomyces sp. INA 01156]
MCLLGDDTTNIGAFHESLNLAAVWHLPIVYVVVNNQLGMGTPVAAAAGEPELFRRGCAHRIPGTRVDGGDVLAVREAAQTVLEQARTEHRPRLLETVSHRLRGHSVVDPARYRTPEEAAQLRQKDPVPAFRIRLIEDGVLTPQAASRIDEEADQQVTAAVDFADASPPGRGHPLRPPVRHRGRRRLPRPSGRPSVLRPGLRRYAGRGMSRGRNRHLSPGPARHAARRTAAGRERPAHRRGDRRFRGLLQDHRRAAGRVRPRRVRDTPICEEGFTGAAIGAAMLGPAPADSMTATWRRCASRPHSCGSTASAAGSCPASWCRGSSVARSGTRPLTISGEAAVHEAPC